MEDILINHGSAIKSLEDGKIGGYLVLYGDETKTDLAGDFFTKSTNFGQVDGMKTPVWFNHRKPIKGRKGETHTVKEQIGEGTLKSDENGIFIEAVLFEREKYEKALTSMGWSSGTSPHTVDREQKGAAFEIKQWLLGHDASITPRPCEPRTQVQSLKSFLDEIESEEDSYKAVTGILEPGLRDNLRFEERLNLVLAANEQVIKDAKEINDMRRAQKVGRKISKARVSQLRDMHSQLAALLAEVESEPQNKEEKSVDEGLLNSVIADWQMFNLMQ